MCVLQTVKQAFVKLQPLRVLGAGAVLCRQSSTTRRVGLLDVCLYMCGAEVKEPPVCGGNASTGKKKDAASVRMVPGSSTSLFLLWWCTYGQSSAEAMVLGAPVL